MDDHLSDPGTAGIHGDVGTQLRAAREAQGYSIAEVAERTRIPSRHLALIESGQIDALPAPTYSVGFVKTYARLLGLDSQALAGQFRRQISHAAPRETMISPYEPADPARTPSRALAWTCFAIAVLLVVAYLYWRGVTAENGVTLAAQTRDHPAAPALVAPPPTAAVVAPPVAGVGQTALLTATAPVWIKVYEFGGKTLFMGLLQPGEHFAVPADAADPRLLTSRPNVLDVTVGATKVPALGAPERRIKDVSLRPAALLARIVPAAASAAPAATPVENSAAPL